MKYVSVVIARDPATGLLIVDQAATQARVAAVKKVAGKPVGVLVARKKLAKKAAKKAVKKVAKKA